MKRLFLTLVTALFVAGVAAADNRPISLDRLPQKAQAFLKQHFSGQDVKLVTQNDDLVGRDYEVMLADGTKIDFSSSGDWHEVTMRQGAVPASVVPAAIAAYVKQHYATTHIVRIERDRNNWELKLSNGLELTFDKHYRVIDIDD